MNTLGRVDGMNVGIKLDIVESGSTITACKMLGTVPETHEPADFSLYVRTVGSTVRVSRSDTDEVIVSGVGFAAAMVALANHYGLPVEVCIDFGVKPTRKTAELIGRYEPTEVRETHRLVTQEDVRAGDLITAETNIGTPDADAPVWQILAVTRVGLVVKDLATGLRMKMGGGHVGSDQGSDARYWHGRVVVKLDAYAPGRVDAACALVEQNGRVFAAEVNSFGVSEDAWGAAESAIWSCAGLIETMTGNRLWVESDGDTLRIRGRKGGFTNWDQGQFDELVDLGVIAFPTVTLKPSARTGLARRARKASKRARGVRA